MTVYVLRHQETRHFPYFVENQLRGTERLWYSPFVWNTELFGDPSSAAVRLPDAPGCQVVSLTLSVDGEAE